MGEPPQRRGIRQVSVVHREQQGLAEGQVCGEPVQTMQHGEGTVLRTRGRDRPEKQITRRSRRPSQHLDAVRRATLGQLPFE